MLKSLGYELKKFYKSKIIRASLIVLFLFMLLAIYIGGSSKISTVFDMQYFLIVNFGTYLVIPFFLTLTSYVFTVELDFNTLKILRCKSVATWKIYVGKFITATTYLLLILLIIYAIPYLNTSKYSIDVAKFNDILVEINSVADSFRFTALLFVRQFLAYLFIVAFTLFLSIMTQNKVIPMIGELVFILLSSTVSSALTSFGMEPIGYFLPLNAENIYRDYATGAENIRVICLLIYTVILGILSIIAYRRTEVKN